MPEIGSRAFILIGALAVAGSCVGQLPPGFTQSTVVGPLGQAIALEFLPDGRLLVADKVGNVTLASGAGLTVQSPYMQIPNVDPDQERGVQSIVLDPQFATNNWFYVYYSPVWPTHFRVSRFTHVQNGGGSQSYSLPASEVVIWQDPLTFSGCCHYGGGMDIGPDGKLYITVGEGTSSALPQDLSSARGKVLRLNLDGTVPADNPYVDGAGPNYDPVWAEGLRNPFRLTWDATYNKVFIADVGANDPATAREEIHVGSSGANFGWPYCEGTQCTWPFGAPPDASAPLFSYQHPAPNYGGAVIGGTVYRGNMFPASFNGVYFYADFVHGWIRYLSLSANGSTVLSDNAFHSSPGLVADMEVGSDGALYFADLNGWVKKVTYTVGDQPPQCNGVVMAPSVGAVPLVSNGGGNVLDPEGSALFCTWLWSDGFQTNVSVPAGAGWRAVPNTPHTYSSSGTFSPVLRVTDGVNTVFCPANTVSVGQGPTCTITTPLNGALFQAGDLVPYVATASDPNGSLTPADYTWEIEFLHDAHQHPEFGPASGFTSGIHTVPFDGHDFSGNTGYEIRLTVEDAEGLVARDTVRIWPEKVTMTFNTVPPGLLVEIDGVQHATPYVKDDLVGFHHYLNAPVQCSGGSQYGPLSWSNGGTGYHQIAVPAQATTYTHTYSLWGPCASTLRVAPKAFLGGPYDAFTGLMVGNLSLLGLVPISEPYTALGVVAAGGGGGESTTLAVLTTTGNNAIVDWVWLELRNPQLPGLVVSSRAALLQRDGDVVDTDGTSPVTFFAAPGNYHVAIRHRNHLGVMTGAPLLLSSTATTIDLTLPGTSTYGTNARTQVGAVMTLWPGNVNFDTQVKYSGASNDRDPILVAIGGVVPTAIVTGQYRREDVNMDGLVKYTGASNDRDPILQAIGGVMPLAVTNQQLP